MTLSDDGDVVRAYGFVAIRFAELEDTLDDRLRQIARYSSAERRVEIEEVIKKKLFSQRIEFLCRCLRQAFDGTGYPERNDDRHHAFATLKRCKEAAKDRNDALHSPIIRDVTTGQMIRNSKETGYSEVTSAEVYNLANAINELEADVYKISYAINKVYGRQGIDDGVIDGTLNA